MQTSTEFLAEIEAFIEKNDIAPSTFGRVLLGDSSFVFGLRDGRIPSVDTCARISRIIKEKQAANLFKSKTK